ncbi:MAG: enoyl-CoA hydratase [Hyphomicrobiales bacterium]|nr:MAG: enoyl-CoA hydratase [Hyphomicrobiales bacterium]
MALVEYELRGHVAVLTLNRPEKRNALNDAMLEELEQAAKRASSEAKAAIICGHGKHFCAGLDLEEQSGKSVMQGIEGSRMWHRVFSYIQRGKIPYFSALHGAVIGGGLELASVSHIRIAETNTFFAMPEGQRGIFVGGGGSVNLTRLIGVSRMSDLMLTGRVYNAAEAERAGIVNYLVDTDNLMDKAMELAERAAENAPLSNYAIINGLQRIHDSGYDEGLFFESMIASLTQSTPEATERMRAFVEKRAARIEAPTKAPTNSPTGGGNDER